MARQTNQQPSSGRRQGGAFGEKTTGKKAAGPHERPSNYRPKKHDKTSKPSTKDR